MGEGLGRSTPSGGWTPPPQQTVPPGFGPAGDASAPGTTFTNPATGQQIHWGGNQWVNNATGGPFTHAHDPESGRTAYQDPKTRGWDYHDAPQNFIVDDDPALPPDQLGFHYVNLNGQHIHYDVHQQSWINDATGHALPPETRERRDTGDEAGRVPVPEPDPTAAPPEDSPAEALAKNSIASSRLKALQLGDDSVPHGTIAKDYAADVKNLNDSIALRDEMVAKGASQLDIDIVDNHIADLQKYIAAWETKGGSVAVNEAAQTDDLTTQVGMTTAIVEIGLQTAGGETAGHLGKFIETQGIGGGGSQTVVPKHKTAKSYLGQEAPAKGPVVEPPAKVSPEPPPSQAATQPLPTKEPANAQGKTQALPGNEAGAEPAGAQGGRTEVGRPPQSQLDDAQVAARAREQAADRAAVKSGFKDHADMEVKLNEQKARQQAFNNVEGDPTLYGARPGEEPGVTADRFGRQHSLDGTKYDPSNAAVNMKGARKDLEAIVTGRSDIPATEKNLEIRFRDYEAAQQAVRDGQAKFQDYWERVPSEARVELEIELNTSQGKDLNYWKGQLQNSGAAVAPYVDTPIPPPPLGPVGANAPSRLRLGVTSPLLAVMALGLVVVAGLALNLLPAASPTAAPSTLASVPVATTAVLPTLVPTPAVSLPPAVISARFEITGDQKVSSCEHIYTVVFSISDSNGQRDIYAGKTMLYHVLNNEPDRTGTIGAGGKLEVTVDETFQKTNSGCFSHLQPGVTSVDGQPVF